MKKQICFMLALCLLITCSIPIVALAADKITADTTPPKEIAIVAPIKLTYDQVYTKLAKDSPNATLIALANKNDNAIATGSIEAVQRITKMEEKEKSDPTISWQLDTSDKASMRANRDFAKAQLEKNITARDNALKSSILKSYYTLQFSVSSTNLAKENMDVNAGVLKNTQLKYKLGTVSKSDLLKAEVAANDAKIKYMQAKDGKDKGFMDLNKSLGYNLMQELILTTGITEIALPTATLDATIKNALVNRNEIAEAKYNYEMSAMSLNALSAYPHSSAKYQIAEAAYIGAKAEFSTIYQEIEMDVRNKYAAMMTNYEAVKLGKISVANADENIRLAELQYNAGLITLTDMNSILVGSYITKQQFEQDLLDYALSVNDYNLAGGIGVKDVKLK